MRQLCVLLLAASAAVSGCSLTVDGRNAGCPYRGEEIHLGAAMLEMAWAEQLYEDVAYLTDGIEVRCVEKLVNGAYAGRTLDKHHIVISTQLDGDVDLPLHRLAYWHELIHAMRWQMSGGPDSEHTGPWWELVSDLRPMGPPSEFNDRCQPP